MAEQDATEDATKDVAEDAAEDVAEDVAEPDATELPEPAPVPDDEFVETAPLEESSEEEPPPPPKRVRKARVEPEPKAEPKRRGRPPGSRNIVRAPAARQDPMAAELPAQSPMEQIMSSMRERRQAHQERQHTFFQSFLP